MLELRGVSYRYPGYARQVLSGIDLSLADGEIVGLVGPNEAGKSTLCLVASGLAPASVGGTLGGEVLIDGRSIAGQAPFELASRVGLVFQNPNTQRSGVTATVFEEVALGPVNLGLELAETVERTRWALATLGIADIAGRDPMRLSGGQAQLVAIASILAMRPPHLVLDEPTAQLDPEGTRLVGEALRALARTGTGLLIAEHKAELLDAICQRVVALDGGQIVLDGTPADVFEDPRIAAIGVEPPARVRIAGALAARGVAAPGPIG
ncbi:MAG TPA: ABC transporter ATP-binding protein [Candidatus Limnocylindrales bacterium]|nr:ABC transporter ATP-binding protein [Candidatus Limnocylindrales bacterium]